MRRLLFVLASIIAVLTFSCDTTQPDFDDAVPDVNTLTTNVTPEGAGEVFPSSGEYVDGTTIEIEAVPNTGYLFERWEGDLVGSLNPTFLSMTNNRTVTAVFSEIDVPLTINVIGQGSVTQTIISQEADESDTAAATINDTINGGEPADSLGLPPKTDQDQDQELQREIDGNNPVGISGSDQQRQRPSFPDERIQQTDIPQQQLQTKARKAITTLELTAVPDEGWNFSRWEGDLTGSQNPDTLVVETESVVTAVFVEELTETFMLELTVEGQGFIEAVPDKLEYSDGEEVTLTAVPDNGWEFSEWRGDLSGSGNPETIIMDSDRQVSSIFAMQEAPELSVNQQPSRTTAGEFITPAPSVRFLDSDDNPVEGVEIQVSLSSQEFSQNSVTTASTNASGIATFPELAIEAAAANYRLRFEAGDTDASSISSNPFDITSAAADPEFSSVTVDDGVAGEVTTIEIDVDDRFGNAVTGFANQIDVTVSGANSATPDVSESEQPGIYLAEYTPENSGNDQIAVSIAGEAVAGTPVESVVTTSDVSSENSSASISPDELVVGEEAVITVTARDAQNNPLSGIEEAIELEGTGEGSVSAFTETADAGVYTATLSSTTPGQLSISVTLSGVTLDEVLVVTFLTGSVDSIEIVSGNNQSAAIASNLPNPLVVRVLDAFDNPVEDESVTFAFDDTPTAAVGQSLDPETALTDANGEASSTVRLGILPGTYTISASAEGAGSVTFTADAVIGQPSVIEILTQPQSTRAGSALSPAPSVEVTDNEGNGVEGITVEAVLQNGNFADGSTLQAVTNSSGVAEFDNLLVTAAGSDYTIRFEPDAQGLSALTSDIFEITPAGADAASTTADVPNGSAGDRTDITISVNDEFGNPVSGVASELSLSINEGDNAGASFAEVTDAGDGTYQTGYTPSSTGSDEITIELSGVAIDGSPFTSNIVATDAENIAITSQPQNTIAGEIVGGSPAVVVTDDLDNPIGNVEVTVTLEGDAGISDGTTILTTNSSGVAVFDDLVIQTSGSFRLRFDALGVSEDALSDLFDVSPAAADALVEISGDGQTGTVNQELDSDFTVQVTDAFGNPVEGETVQFAISSSPDGSGGASLSVGSVTTNSSGNASSRLTLGSVTGDYSVEATSAVGSVIFTATALPGAAETFEFDPIGSPQVAGNPFVVSITAFDGNGNIATGYGGTADLTTTAGTITPGTITFSSGEGSANVTLSQTGSGQTITAADGDVSGTSNAFDVESGGASALTVAEQPTRTTAGQAISPAPSVLIEDSEGNAVEGVSVSVRASGAGLAPGSTTEAATNASGFAEFDDLILRTAGTYTLTFETDAAGVAPVQSETFTIVAAEGDPELTDASVPNGTAGEETRLTITVLDQFENRVEGVAGQISVDVGGANDASPAVTESGDGVYVSSYTPLSSGTDIIEIRLDGTPISRSPYSSTVSTSQIDAGESTVTASPASVVVGNSSQVTINLSDSNGNPISGLSNTDFDISVSGNATAGAVGESSDSGTYRFSVSNIRAQTVTVSVEANGISLDDTPSIEFRAGAPDLLFITSQPQNTTAGEVISNTPEVRVTDEFNNNVPGIEIEVEEQDGQEFDSGTLRVETNSSGIARFDDLVITDAGRYNLVFTEASGLSVTSNAFNVTPGQPDADETTADVPNGAAGDQTTVTITARDSFGNLVEGAAGSFSLTVSGANSGATFSQVSDQGNGIYTSSYSPTATGSDQITIELDGAEIDGSPFTSNVITSDADEIVITTQPSETVAGEQIAGPPSVEILDNLGNPVNNVEVVVSIEGSATFDDGQTTRTTGGNGIVEFNDLVIETAGTYTLVFNAIGVSENAASNAFDVVAADADALTRVSGNNQGGTITSTLDDPLVVRVVDNFGNPVSGATVDFEVTGTPPGASGQSLGSNPVTSGSDGLAQTTFTLGNIAGIYEVRASASGAGNVVFSATATAATASSFSFDEITSPQTAGQPFNIRIVALDDQGNTATGYQGTADLTADSGSIIPENATFANGIASLDVSLTSASGSQSILAADGSVTGASNTFVVQSGGVNASNSSVSVSPTTLPAGDASTLTIELRDGSNNLVSGLSDGDFTISLTGDANAGSVSESSNGVYSAAITNQTAETVDVTVQADGTTLADSPSVTFTAADAQDISRVSGNNQTGTVTQPLATDFVVNVVDEFGNDVPGATVEFSITDVPMGATGQSLSSASSVTNSNGNASTRLTLGSRPGEYTVDATVTGVGTVEFSATAQIGSPSELTIVSQPENSVAGESISPSPQVRIRDNAGNVVRGVSVTVREAGGYTFDGGTLTQTTSASGVAVFDDLVIEAAGEYTIVFDVLANGVDDVNSDSFLITPAAASPGNSSATVPDGTAGEETTLSVIVEDEFGNRVTGVGGSISVSVTGANTAAPVVSETAEAGVYRAAYTPISAGTDIISIEINGSDISGSPYNSTVTTSGISSSESSVTASPTSLQAGSSSQVTVQVRDAVGNLIPGLSGSSFALSVSGDATLGTVSETSTDGIYQFTVRNTTAQTVSVTVEVNGVALDDSPQIEFSAAQPDNFSIETNPGDAVAGGIIPGPPSVLIEDRFDNPVPNVSVSVVEQSGEEFAGGTTAVQTNAAGIAAFDDLSITTAGQYNLVFSSSGLNNQTSSVFDVIAASASELRIDSGNNQTGTVGQALANPLAVIVADEFGNSVPGEEVTFAVASTPAGSSGSSISETTVQTDANGIASTSLTLGDVAGTYDVTASANGLDEVTFTATATAGSVSTFAFESIPGPQTAGSAFEISIDALDSGGNIVSGYSGTASLSTTAGSVTPNSATFTSGVATLNVSVSNAGADQTITAEDGSITGTSNTFDVLSGGVDAGNSTVAASPLTLQAGQSSTITIELRDGSNNPVSGVDAGSFTINLTGDATAGSVSETTAGTYSASITNETAETVTATVTVSGTQISQTADIEFTPADADAASTIASVPNGAAGDATSIVITVSDEFGNRVTGAESLLNASVTSGPNAGASFTAISGNGNGTYTTSYTPQTIGTDEITITLDGTEISGSPYSSTVTTSDVSATNSSATASPTNLIVGNSSTVTVVLRDGSNNPVAGLSASDFNVSANGSATVGSVSEIATDGTYEFSVINEVAETVTVTVTATGTTLQDTPSIEFTVGQTATITVTTQPGNITAGQSIAGPPTVTLEDAFDNPVPGIDVTVSEQSGQTFDSGTLTVQTNADGVAAFSDLVLSSAGQYNLVFNEPGGRTATSNAFAVSAAAGDAAQTTATVPNGAAGDATSVVVTVADQFGNAVSGAAGDIDVSVTGGPNAGEAFTSVTGNGDGTYTTSYTPQVIGTDEITITLGGTEISGSPYTSTVTTSDVSATNSSATANPTTLEVGGASTVTVSLRDGSNNPVSGLSSSDFDVNAGGSATSSTVTETSTAGTYEFTVSNQAAESVTVTISATGTTINDAPVITYTAGSPDRILVSTQPLDATAGESIPGPPSVTLEDAFNNPVPSIDVTVSEQGGESFAGGTLTVQTDAAGTATFSDLVINDAGQYNLVFSEPDGETATSNAFDVTAADADAGQTTATVPNGSAGDRTNITITVNDAYGNSVTGVAGDLAVTVDGENAGATVDAVTGNGDGTYSTGYTPTATGDDTITITLEGTAIQGSPFTSTIITSNADVVEVTTEPAQTVAGQPVAGPPTTLVTDNLANPVSGIDVVAALNSGSFVLGSTSTVTSGTNGESVFDNLVINQAGTYTIDFSAQGVTDPVTSVSFEVISAAASNLVIETGNNQTATVTQSLANPLTVLVTDEFGNPVEGESVSFAISDVPAGATGQTLSSTSVQTDADGLASATLTLGNLTGDYDVTASGTGIGPVIFTATANAGAASQFAFGTISSPQTAGSGFTISLTAQDSEGNTAVNYGGTATLSTTAGTITPTTAGFTGGIASVNVTLSSAGADQTITATDGSITGTSNAFDVQSGGIDAANSSVSASPLTLQVGQSSTLTIDLRDGSNNAVAGLDAGSFTVTPTGDATAGSITETSPGIYEVDITNQTAQNVSVSVTASGTLLNDSPQIEFTAGALAALNLVSGNNQTGTVAQQLPADFIVEAEDSFGNPVSGVQVNFAIDQIPSGATGQALTNLQIPTGSLGQASTRLTLGGIPGTYTVDASASGVGSITFSAEAEIGDPSVMSVTTQPGETIAGTTIAPSPEVTITDDAGNPIQGISVGVSELGDYSFDSGTQSVLTDANGVASFGDLVINRADRYTLVFDADDVNAPLVANVNSTEFDVVAAAGDPLNSTAAVPDGAAGDPTTITISVWDEFDNPVTGASGNLNVSFVAGPNSTSSSFSGITDNLDGTYTTSYTPSATGKDEISITLNGTNVGGTTYFSTVETSDVNASNSTVTASPTSLQAGANSLVTVEVRDGSNNAISGLVSSDFSISVSGDGSAGSITETATDGTYQFNVSNTTAEQVTVSVTATGTTLLDTPTITFTAADADLMLITQQPLLSEAGQPIAGPPSARITDEYGNRVPNVEVTISEQGGQPFAVGSTTILNTNSLGQAIFDNIAIEQAGDYNLVFSVDGITNRTSNLFTVTASDPDADQTTATVPNGSAGVRTQISITVRDAFNNRVEGAASQIGVQISGANDGSTLEGIVENGDGVYSTAYSPSATGTDNIVITIDGTAIAESPFTSTVTTSDADNVALSQQPLETVAGNTIAGSPSVIVTDEFGNEVSGIEVNVSEGGGADFNAGQLTVTTDVNGVALFDDLQINTAGTYTLVFDAVGVELDATSDPFTVTAAAGDPAFSTASVAAGTAGQATEITITIEDQFENPVSGVQGDIGISVSSGPNTGAGVSSVVDQGNGVYTASYIPTITGTDTLTVTLSAIEISNSPVTSIVSAGAATTLEISQQPADTEAGSALSPAPVSIVRDSEGNGVPGVDVTATLSSNGFTTASTVTVTTDSDGIATFNNLIIETAATGYTITFETDADGVAGIESSSFDVTAAID